MSDIPLRASGLREHHQGKHPWSFILSHFLCTRVAEETFGGQWRTCLKKFTSLGVAVVTCTGEMHRGNYPPVPRSFLGQKKNKLLGQRVEKTCVPDVRADDANRVEAGVVEK